MSVLSWCPALGFVRVRAHEKAAVSFVILAASPVIPLAANLPVLGGGSKTSTESGASAGFDLAKAAQKANNPVSDAWLLITQHDCIAIEGYAVDGTEYRNRASFQPVLPVPTFGGDWNLVNRPVFQFLSSPVDDDIDATDPFDERTNGLGDTISFSLLAPNRDDGFIWGVGPTLILPTATEDVLWQVEMADRSSSACCSARQ